MSDLTDSIWDVLSLNPGEKPPLTETKTWIEWGVTPQAALDVGNPTHVLGWDWLRTEEDARAFQRRMGGIVRRRRVTSITTDWEDVP